jgi:hypothetical protein
MQGILVAVFESRERADAARDALLEQEFHDAQIGVEGGDTRAQDEVHGLAGVIARMFSGFATPPDTRTRDYADVVARGGALLALHGIDDNAVARATAILLEHGARDVQPHGTAAPGEAPKAGDTRVERELVAVSSVGGPQVHALPNAPVDWDSARGSTSAQRTTEDPAQPRGELAGTDVLGAKRDREMLKRRKARR